MNDLAHMASAPSKEASDLETHVALCTERYDRLHGRLGNLERILVRLLVIVATGFAGVLMTMLGYILTRIQ